MKYTKDIRNSGSVIHCNVAHARESEKEFEN